MLKSAVLILEGGVKVEAKKLKHVGKAEKKIVFGHHSKRQDTERKRACGGKVGFGGGNYGGKPLVSSFHVSFQCFFIGESYFSAGWECRVPGE